MIHADAVISIGMFLLLFSGLVVFVNNYISYNVPESRPDAMIVADLMLDREIGYPRDMYFVIFNTSQTGVVNTTIPFHGTNESLRIYLFPEMSGTVFEIESRNMSNLTIHLNSTRPGKYIAYGGYYSSVSMETPLSPDANATSDVLYEGYGIALDVEGLRNFNLTGYKILFNITISPGGYSYGKSARPRRVSAMSFPYICVNSTHVFRCNITVSAW